MIVRPAVERDLPALTEIYNHYVRTSHATFDVRELTVDERREWFGHYAVSGPHRLLVAEEDGQVLGYASSGRFRAKPSYGTSVETTVYRAPDAHGRGLGRLLMASLLEALRGEDLHRAYAGVALPNDASERLHRGLGFREIGVYHQVGRKFGRWWDVRWFELALPWRPGGTAVEVRRPSAADDGFVETTLASSWGPAMQVAAHGVLFDAAQLPGYVALVDGEPAGVLTYHDDGDEREVVTVDAVRRGVGVAAALLAAAERDAQVDGKRRLWLVTTNDNTSALRAYQRAGWELVAVHPGAVADARRLKPSIPFVGLGGVPIRDELVLERRL
ncbi:MAG: phosphinothricin acetyltransferase [Actinomycetota bacterium]|nr:phosphinothricin acetyltransferase [Actinomycetota bacterium]